MDTTRKRRLFAAGKIPARIGPARQTTTGTTLRLVTVIGTAGLRITEVRQTPTTPEAA